MSLDLDAIEAALAAMTAAPWAANGLDSGDERWRRANSVWTNHHPIARDEDGEEMCVASSSHDWGTVESPDERDANMRGIALLRNAAPEMVRRIREQDATIAELRALCGDAADAIRTLEDTPHYIATEYESLRARLRAASKGEQ